MELKDKQLYSIYFDFYKELLTKKQKEYFEMHVIYDNSFAEISNEFGVSRNAVHDSISRTIKALLDYEKKLGLYAKSVKRDELLSLIETDENKNTITELRELD